MLKKDKNFDIDLLGPFGSGKGTQAQFLVDDLGLSHFVMGDALKQEIANKSKIGQKIEKIVKAGDLVGDDVIGEILDKFLAQFKQERGIIFDGLPRNMAQKIIFDRTLEKYKREPLFVFVDISREESFKRLSNRRICSGCGDQPVGSDFSKKDCQKCGGKLATRYDDSPKIIRHRIKVYEQEVRPVIKAYLETGKMLRVNGEQEPEAVHREIMKIIEEKGYPIDELHKK